MNLNIAAKLIFIGFMSLTTGATAATQNVRGGASKERNLNDLTVRDVITSVALQNGNEFSNIESYQSLALDFVETEATSEFVDYTAHDRLIQRYALACIYFSTYAVSNTMTDNELGFGILPPGWVHSQNWVTPNIDMCDWHGITCNEEQMVNSIVLTENRLTGVFPPEVSLLKDTLQEIDLYHNDYLQGGIGNNGNAWMGELTELRKLFFAFCKFESYTGIPTEIGLLTNLEELDTAFNLYVGQLNGATFAPLQNLVYLDISGGKYDSSIPDELASLPNLEDFHVTDSFITGDISSYLPKMNKIVQHTADHNSGLGGTIPDGIAPTENSISDSIMLLSYENCNITGSIPPSVGSLSNLVKLYLNDNNLEGLIPTELSNLPYLTDLVINGNDIMDTMPTEICSKRHTGSELSIGTITTLVADCQDPPNLKVSCTCCTSCGDDELNMI